ncbi:hypothetical protein C8A05DRAFT_36632 [Staphylotrichum tortipilum]|uniref:DUF7136 domain-containing protein n=1 Tax=Staphylotrichum tortipilum TaxID=2831512 RepID=A0AAN6MF50_9PEZI|nr:hypothetical protein C8A05DRAFT_36632 [Staphylotrichum longicolle]
MRRLSVLASVACLASATSTPNTVEFDLVYPRDNQSYQPTPHMPVVIAIHNAKLAQNLHPYITFRVQSTTDSAAELTWSTADTANNTPYFVFTFVDAFPKEGGWTIWWNGLVDLPTEILEMICLYLAYDDAGEPRHPHDLLRLGRTSKRIYFIVQPMLYRTIVACSPAKGSGPAPRVRLGDLIRTLWKTPEFGSIIRHVILDVLGQTPKLRSDDGPKPRSDGRKRYNVYGSVFWNKEALSEAVRRFLGRNLAKMPVPSSIAIWCQRSPLPVFLLLAMAPNVSNLELTVSRNWDLNGLTRHAPSPGGAVAPRIMLPSLSSLTIRLHEIYDVRRSSDHMRVVIHLFLAAAPRLTTLELRDFPRLLDLPRLTYLQSLVLVNTHLSQHSLAKLTNTAPALKRLCTFYYGNTPLPSAATLEADYDGANEDLVTNRLNFLSHSPLAATLKTIVFSDYMLSDMVVRSMPRFANLTVLGVRYFGYDQSQYASPAPLITLLRGCTKLRGLLITGAFRMGSAGLKEFAEAVAAGEFSSLVRVKLVARDTCLKELKRIVKEPVPGLLEVAGVELAVGLHELEGTAGLVKEMEEAV